MVQTIIISALAQNNVIGNKGDIPWRIRDDFKRFKEMTFGHPIIMGRKTYESLPIKPLPGRENIVLTSDKEFNPPNVTIVNSFEQALTHCAGKEKVFLCGGSSVYKMGIPIADTLELTRVHKDVEGDTMFPHFDLNEWDLVKKEDKTDEKEGNYSFLTYSRKKK